MAELWLVRAEHARTPLEFATHAREVRKLADLIVGHDSTAYGYHTLAKLGLTKLGSLLSQRFGAETTEFELDQVIRQTSEAIDVGLQRFPDDPYLLDAESKLGELLADEQRVIAALRTAFQKNPLDSYAAVRLAKQLAASDHLDEAAQVCHQALEAGSHDKRLHYTYARFLLDLNGDQDTIEYHLRRAFTKGDRNYEAQFWYARQLYINAKIPESLDIFSSLRAAPIDPDTKRTVRGVIQEGGAPKVFTGRIVKLESSYAFIERDGPADTVFLHISTVGESAWNSLGFGTRVKFPVGFTFWGPAALGIAPE